MFEWQQFWNEIERQINVIIDMMMTIIGNKTEIYCMKTKRKMSLYIEYVGLKY